jgi:hypothetical protein
LNCNAKYAVISSIVVLTAERLNLLPQQHLSLNTSLPLSKGGTTSFENLCLACPSCNRYKAARQMATDPATQAEVPLFHPQQQAWTEHFKWNEAATEIGGLSSIGRATLIALKMNRPQLLRVRRMWVKMGEHPPTV